MKKLFVGVDGIVKFDSDTNEIFDTVDTYHEIYKIFPVDEDIEIIYKIGTTSYTQQAKKGSVVILFYKSSFEKPFLVVENEEWYNMLQDKIAKEQKEKEEWAAAKCECESCLKCKG